MRRLTQILIRILPPVGILAASVYAYSIFSVEPDEEKQAVATNQKIRTRVTRLESGRYQVRVTTNGSVVAYNHVTLAANVSGDIVVVNPEIEVGSYFAKGDVLVEIDDRDYRAALAVARADEQIGLATLRHSKNVMSRAEKLSLKNANSESEVDEARANLARAEAELQRIATQIETAERDLERTKVIAPFDGRVERKLVGVGERVAVGAPLARVFAVDYAEVRLPLATQDLRFLSLPEKASDPPVDVELRDAIDESNATIWNSRIVRTEGTLDADSLELYVVARIDDPFGLETGKPPLRIGQPVVASIKGHQLQNVTLLPRGAVRQLDQIYLVDKHMTIRSATIEPIWTDEEYVVIEQDVIADDDLLATTMLVYAPDGSDVEIIPDVVAAEKTDSALIFAKAHSP